MADADLPVPRTRELMAVLRELARADSTEDVLRLTVVAAVRLIPAAEAASIVGTRRGRLTTLAATGDEARQLDRRYAEVSESVGEAVLAGHGSRSLSPTYFAVRGVPTVTELDATLTAVTVPMQAEGTIGQLRLTCYAGRSDPGAPAYFDDRDIETAVVVAGLGSLAATSVRRAERAGHLDHALTTNRKIAVAMGILMAQSGISEDDAFALMRDESQRTHRRLADIAIAIVDGVTPNG